MFNLSCESCHAGVTGTSWNRHADSHIDHHINCLSPIPPPPTPRHQHTPKRLVCHYTTRTRGLFVTTQLLRVRISKQPGGGSQTSIETWPLSQPLVMLQCTSLIMKYRTVLLLVEQYFFLPVHGFCLHKDNTEYIQCFHNECTIECRPCIILCRPPTWPTSLINTLACKMHYVFFKTKCNVNFSLCFVIYWNL